MSTPKKQSVRQICQSYPEAHYLSEEQEFDARGNLILRVTKEENGEETSRSAFVYDDQDRMVEEKNEDDPENPLMIKYFYEKGDKVSRVECFFDGDDEPYQLVEYQYEPQKEIVNTYCPADELTKCETYIYDDQGHETEYHLECLDGSELGHSIHTNYDESSKIIQKDQYNLKGKLVSISKYIYEPLEDGTEKLTVRSIGNGSKVFNEYWEIHRDGKKVTEGFYSDLDNRKGYSLHYTFGTHKEPERVVYKNDKDEPFAEEQYHYNAHNDLIKREIKREVQWIDHVKTPAVPYECFVYEIVYHPA